MAEMVSSFAREHLIQLLRKIANITRDTPKEIAEIEDELEMIQAFLNIADRSLEAEEDTTRYKIKTMKLLREAAFRMEDIIDEYMIYEKQHSRDPSCASLLCEPVHFIRTMIIRRQIANKFQDIKSQVREIIDRNASYGFQIQSSLEQGPSSSTGNQDVTLHKFGLHPSYIEETEVVGFEYPNDELIHFLIGERAERAVISLVGMGGLGKTTLAKLVFDNKKVIQHFNCHAWITVSQSYTVNMLLRNMLQQFYKENNEDLPQDIHTMDVETLMMEARSYLRQKRYVVLFDDVWNEHFWDQIEFALPKNKNGSRIIITTRNMNVAYCCKKTSFVHVHELERLNSEQSLLLFYKKVFGYDFDGYCPVELRDISREIVEKCGGLPLAVVAIGGLLSTKSKNALEWEKFSQNLNLELGKNSNLIQIKNIFGISYHDLPYHLRRCFLYFGVYPPSYEVESGRLIRQWVAEGFVKYERGKTLEKVAEGFVSSEGGKTLEEVAEQYLAELIHRNLVQVSSFASDGKSRRCCVHDLLHDMILTKVADLSFSHFVSEDNDQSVFSGMIRHQTIATSSNNLMETGESASIRSLHIFRDEELPESFVRSIPKKYRLLRVLDFQDVPLYNVPENLGYLFNLRYLSFRNTKLSYLPTSIGTLHQLETLDLRQTMVREVPREINNLKKLRHLLAYDLSMGVRYGIRMNDGIGDLTSLQTLREVETERGGVELIEKLARLRQLRVLGLTHVRQEFTSALCSSINKMQHLEKLYIAARDVYEVIDLHFHVSAPLLRKLRLIGKLDLLPDWLPALQNLVKLSLSHSQLTHDPLTSLKDMPNLLYLSIHYRAYEGECLHFPEGGFQQLQQLVLTGLYNLNSILMDRGALLSLKKFMLVDIPQLKKVPFGIYNLPKLQVFHIMNMPDEFEESIDRDRGQHQWIIEKVPFESMVHRYLA